MSETGGEADGQAGQLRNKCVDSTAGREIVKRRKKWREPDMIRRCLLLTRRFIDKMLETVPEKRNGIN